MIGLGEPKIYHHLVNYSREEEGCGRCLTVKNLWELLTGDEWGREIIESR